MIKIVYEYGLSQHSGHIFRAISSAGEHLVYTERVGGSNPSSPTTFLPSMFIKGFRGSIVEFLTIEWNNKKVNSEWQFTTIDARIKLKKLYPILITSR